MAQHVNLDSMIPRADFAVQEGETNIQQISDFSLRDLQSEAPILRQLRKADFQRETNHWAPEQITTFIASFLDNEVVPSFILWKSQTFVFVIDGGHRLSALRAWMEDDYGDGHVSLRLYNGVIPAINKRIAKRTRDLIDARVGRYATLAKLVGNDSVPDQIQKKRASNLFVRALQLQWVTGDASVAETSFSKINSQGTPLDDVEAMLINNRRRPVAIAARAIVRAGAGHKYWSSFDLAAQTKIEALSAELYKILFEPEVFSPIKTLDIPLGGSVSPVEALALLIDFLSVASADSMQIRTISDFPEDSTGDATIQVLTRAMNVAKRITGNSAASLGLHPIVYFYNEKGRYNRFLFLGMVMLIADRMRNNDDSWFRVFTDTRSALEEFLVDNKPLISRIPQNMNRPQRVPKMRDFFNHLINEIRNNRTPTPESLIAALGLRGRFFELGPIPTGKRFSDDTKSSAFVGAAIKSALKCPICRGFLDQDKSVSYDHIKRVKDGGLGDEDNAQLVHPYCNTGVKN